jgi:hypothetical protein
MAGLSGLSGMSGLFGLMGGIYSEKVRNIQPANLNAYWPLWETAGAVADNLEGTAARDGAYSNVTLGQTGIGDGYTCPSFNGVTSYVNIYSASLNGVWNGGLFTISAWVRVGGAGVWTDGVVREAFHIGANTTTNLVQIRKDNAANTLRCQYRAGGVIKTVDHTISSTDWIHVLCTVSAAADEFRFFVAGSQVGLTQNGLGVWVGALGANVNCIGSQTTAPVSLFSGYLAHVAIWNAVLTPAERASLAVV